MSALCVSWLMFFWLACFDDLRLVRAVFRMFWLSDKLIARAFSAFKMAGQNTPGIIEYLSCDT